MSNVNKSRPVVLTNPFKPGDLIRRRNGKQTYMVFTTSGGWVSIDAQNNWKHFSGFVLVRDGEEFRKDLKQRLENYLNEHGKQETSKEPEKTEGEGGGTAVTHEDHGNSCPPKA